MSCFVIAEVAQAHDGSLGTAHSFIDAIAETGADAVKFQTHIAEAESGPDEPWRVKFSPQDATRYDYWKRTGFDEPQWRALKQHAEDRGLEFLSSPFSVRAVEMLDGLGMRRWKIASGEVTNTPLLAEIAKTGKPVILSSGMSSVSDLERAKQIFSDAGCPVSILQCTTAYPCPAEQVGLNVMSELRDRFGCDVGLSDHSGTIFPGLAAATLGATIVEVHVTLSRYAFGPDVKASLTIEELAQLVEGIRFLKRCFDNPVDKDAAASGLTDLRTLFGQSIVGSQDLPAGTVLTERHLSTRKPGTGIPADRWEAVIGKTLREPVRANQMIEPSMLTDETHGN